MNRLRVATALLALAAATLTDRVNAAPAKTPALEPGVSRALARWRASQYRDVRYALAIRLAAGAATLGGTLEMKATLPAKPVDLVLDWRPAAEGAAVGVRF